MSNKAIQDTPCSKLFEAFLQFAMWAEDCVEVESATLETVSPGVWDGWTPGSPPQIGLDKSSYMHVLVAR
jgi:hypothetical protein